MYHYVRDLKHSRYPRIKGLDLNLFREQIKFLKKNYNFVTVEEVIEANNGGGTLPSHPVLLTFDDAYQDHYQNVFPILNQPYDPADENTQYFVIDGFIVSPNVEVEHVETIDLAFANTDHNPVQLVVRLK